MNPNQQRYAAILRQIVALIQRADRPALIELYEARQGYNPDEEPPRMTSAEMRSILIDGVRREAIGAGIPSGEGGLWLPEKGVHHD